MINLGIAEYFGNTGNLGPNVFMKRLSESITRQNLANIVNLNEADISLIKIRVDKKYNKQFVLRVDGIYFDSKNTQGDTEELNKTIFDSIDRASGIVFISDFSRLLVEKFHKKVNKPYTVIHNAVDLNLFSPYGNNNRQKLEFKESDFVIVVSASWRRWKRLKEITILFNKLRKEISNISFKLLVLGNNPDYVVNDKDIKYVGEIPSEDLPSWYRSGNLYLHLATLEPCGNTQIEAIACGLPTICTNNGGIKETIISANAGIVSQADPVYTFEKIDHYNPNPPDYNILIKDLREIITNYSRYKNQIKYSSLDINIAAQKYVEFIEKVYKNNTSSTK